MDFFLFLTFKHKNHKIELEIWIHILILKTCKLTNLSMKILTCNYMLLIKIILLYFTGFKGLSSLKKLEILDISGNEFDKSDLKSLGVISSLKTLALCSMGWIFSHSRHVICLHCFFKIKYSIFLTFNVP